MKMKDFDKKIDEYLETQSEDCDEWYGPIRELHEKVLIEFLNWLFFEDIQKEQRRKRWGELKKELEELNKEFGDAA